ncbi:hypothetical protein Tcan_04304 [Toxocara canis]|uniref:Uncharacterized protein n=1 Tax=Toxocara canis TaxID=6265 RepID=A0A0B2VB43_TOXCA|nr:hypothetical protein Tcan_04304 [Toxocara canis]
MHVTPTSQDEKRNRGEARTMSGPRHRIDRGHVANKLVETSRCFTSEDCFAICNLFAAQAMRVRDQLTCASGHYDGVS